MQISKWGRRCGLIQIWKEIILKHKKKFVVDDDSIDLVHENDSVRLDKVKNPTGMIHYDAMNKKITPSVCCSTEKTEDY